MKLPLSDGFFIESDGSHNMTLWRTFVMGEGKKGKKPRVEGAEATRPQGYYPSLTQALAGYVKKATLVDTKSEGIDAILAKLEEIRVAIKEAVPVLSEKMEAK